MAKTLESSFKCEFSLYIINRLILEIPPVFNVVWVQFVLQGGLLALQVSGEQEEISGG